MSKSQLLKPTPLEKIDSFYLKREDLNPSGSVKDRAVIKQLFWARKQGYQKVAASTSGNLGIALGFWAKNFSLSAAVFISPQTDQKKYSRLQELPLDLKISLRPISDCFRFCQQTGALNLRQSQDPRAFLGYSALGREIAYQIKNFKVQPKAIFFPVSSGATLRGVMRGLQKSGLSLPCFLVQPASHAPLGKIFDQNFRKEKKRLADALVAKIFPQKEKILMVIKKNQGGGIVVQNKDLLKWDVFLRNKGVKTSYEGALTLAGAEKGRKMGLLSGQTPVLCLLTGRKY